MTTIITLSIKTGDGAGLCSAPLRITSAIRSFPGLVAHLFQQFRDGVQIPHRNMALAGYVGRGEGVWHFEFRHVTADRDVDYVEEVTVTVTHQKKLRGTRRRRSAGRMYR